MKRVALIASVVGIFSMASSAIVNANSARRSEEGACLGLACAPTGDADHVPAAVTAVAVPKERTLEAQDESGFYSFDDPSYPDPVVAYVATDGSDGLPANVADLPIARENASAFDEGTVVVLDPGMMQTSAPPDLSGRSTRRTSIEGHCANAHFCLYNDTDFRWDAGDCCNYELRILGSEYVGEGWIPLSNFWSNNVRSVKNMRDNDNGLAAGANGGGVDYCSDSNSEDASLLNNAIDHHASSFTITGGDWRC